ncbi:MAG TPA: SUMF1/EgtB/PvdO family nonheme iron enzyme [Polyangiaceae bacterium]|nr:SUMF1/EgtB/PvdO family nonheme iron enzyme [Polyangiaceae bacterium]
MVSAAAVRRLAPLTLGLAIALGAASAPAEPPSAPPAARAEREVAVGSGIEPRGVARLESPRGLMVRIGAGSFQMGSDEAEVLSALADCVREAYGHRCSPTLFSNETPRHEVHLSSYWLDRFEVSVAQYERCVEVGRCEPRPTSEATRRFDRADFPVTRVSWSDAAAYCAFRGARLPTEAEFERAARGVRGRRYPWGDLFNTRANNHGRFGWDVTEDADGFAELAPLGSFPDGVTPEGVYDLAGNVAEWVLDRYAPTYDVAESSDPRGPGLGGSNLRVVRGGSYAQPRFRVRGAARAFAEPGERRSSLGFRCARSERPRRDGSSEPGADGAPAPP